VFPLAHVNFDRARSYELLDDPLSKDYRIPEFPAVDLELELAKKTAFATYDSLFEEIHGGRLPNGLLRKYHQFIADHRLNVDNIYRSTPPDIETIEYFHKRGQLNAFNLKYIGGRIEAKDSISNQAYLDSLAELLDPYVAELRRRGLAKKAYLYGFDEIGGEMYEVVKSIFAFLTVGYVKSAHYYAFVVPIIILNSIIQIGIKIGFHNNCFSLHEYTHN